MLFKVKLLNSTFPVKQEHLIPNVKEISDALIGLIGEDCKNQRSLVRYFNSGVPFFSIPNYSIINNFATVESNTFYIHYKGSVSKTTVEYLKGKMREMTRLFGQPAFWSISDDIVVPNCYPYYYGVSVPHSRGEVFYLLNETLPKAKVSLEAPQRLSLSVAGNVSDDMALRFTNSFHRYLVSKFFYNHQAIGQYGVTRLKEEESLHYFCGTEDGKITSITIECLTGITDELVEFLQTDKHVSFFESQTPVQFSLSSNEYFIQESHTAYKTETPAMISSNTLKENNPRKGSAAFYLDSIFQVLDIKNRTITEATREGDWVVFKTEALGQVSIKAHKLSDEVTTRGGRLANIQHDLEIRFERPVALSALGAQRNFGAGRLSPV